MTAATAPPTFTPFAPGPVRGPTLLNLLIAEPERSVRDGCREAGSLLEYRTRVTESADQVMRTVESQNIDVVLVNFAIPGASGLELLKQLKSHHPDIEVIIVATPAFSLRLRS
jgi:DNA-binding NtrC family response regulator